MALARRYVDEAAEGLARRARDLRWAMERHGCPASSAADWNWGDIPPLHAAAGRAAALQWPSNTPYAARARVLAALRRPSGPSSPHPLTSANISDINRLEYLRAELRLEAVRRFQTDYWAVMGRTVSLNDPSLYCF